MSIPRISLGATPRQSDSASYAPARTPIRPPAAVLPQDILQCIRQGILHAFRQPDVQSAVAESLAPFITAGERGKKRGRPLRDGDDDDDDDGSEPADRRSSSRGLDGTILKARQDVVELMDSKTVRSLFFHSIVLFVIY